MWNGISLQLFRRKRYESDFFFIKDFFIFLRENNLDETDYEINAPKRNCLRKTVRTWPFTREIHQGEIFYRRTLTYYGNESFENLCEKLGLSQ